MFIHFIPCKLPYNYFCDLTNGIGIGKLQIQERSRDNLIEGKCYYGFYCRRDTNLSRHYSRDFMVQRTKEIVWKYPEQLIHIKGCSEDVDSISGRSPQRRMSRHLNKSSSREV